MGSTGNKNDGIFFHTIDKAILFINFSAPVAVILIFQRFRLTNAQMVSPHRYQALSARERDNAGQPPHPLFFS
jgi:hypothetical protein